MAVDGRAPSRCASRCVRCIRRLDRRPEHRISLRPRCCALSCLSADILLTRAAVRGAGCRGAQRCGRALRSRQAWAQSKEVKPMTQKKGGEEAKSSRGPWRREPHTYEARALTGKDRFWNEREIGVLPARGCPMEAYGEATNRTQVKRREACVCRVSRPAAAKPNIRRAARVRATASSRSSVFLPGEISRPPLAA